MRTLRTLRTFRLTARFLIAMTVPGMAAFGSGWGGCGPTLRMADPALRALFAELDRTAEPEFKLICAKSRALAGR